jgi:hypothetical protein
VEVGTVPDAARPRATDPSAEAPSAAKQESATSKLPEAAAPADPAESPRSNAHREPARAARPRPAAARPAAPAGVSVAQKTSDEAGSFGAVALPQGTQYFAKAFARALPVVLGDSAWLGLPLGHVGRASVDVSIDAAGRIAEVELDPRTATPAILKRALDRVFVLLDSGTFSLDGQRVKMGVERLSLSVELSQRAANPDETADPKLMSEKGHLAPSRERPGSAHLTFNSGRRVDVLIRMRSVDEP